MSHGRELLSLHLSLPTRSIFLVAFTLISVSVLGQTPIASIDTTMIVGDSTGYVQFSPNDAINEIIPENDYVVLNGQDSNARVKSYTVLGRVYDNFLIPDTVAIRRTDGSRFINIWYTLIEDPFLKDTLKLAPDVVEDADLIYRNQNLNSGYDNILVNIDDDGLGAIQAQTERVDIIWRTGIRTCEPDSAIFPVVERVNTTDTDARDEIKVAGITALDENGDPSEFTSLVTITESDWSGSGPVFDNFLVLRRETLSQQPLPLANIGTFVRAETQPNQTIKGVAVSFTDLGISADQVVYGYSLFATDVDPNVHTLTDISTYPTNTLATVSGIDLIAGVTAAVSADKCLVPNTGPGGYKAALATWLKANEKADVTTSTEGATVTTWKDHWTAENDFTSGGFIKPVYRDETGTQEINFNESVDFIGSTSMSTPANAEFDTATYEKKGINIAFRSDNSDVTSRQVVFEQGDNNRGLVVYIRAGNIHVSAWNQPSTDGAGDNWNTGTITTISDTVSTNREYIITLELNGNETNTGTLTAYKNGRSIGNISGVGRLFDHRTGGIEFGGSDGNLQYDDGTNSSANNFAGEISELIYCNEPTAEDPFPLAQRNRIESYLALKYGITLNQNTPYNYVNSSGNVIFDVTNNASIGGYLEYNNDIAGIGRDDGSEFEQLKSKSENNNTIVTIERSTSFSRDNTFLIWGNDDGVRTNSETVDIPDILSERVKRVWRVAEEESSGNVTMTFDLDELSISGSPDASDYTLLIAANSSNGSFVNAEIITGGVVDGTANTITFSGVNLNNGQYFTLGTGFDNCGPGGVNNSNGLTLWLKANQGPNATTNNANVTSWEDKAFGNNATEPTTGGIDPPNYVSNGLNFNPVLNFDGGNEYLEGSAGFNSAAYYLVIIPDDGFNSSSTAQIPLGYDTLLSSGTTTRLGGFYLGDVFTSPTADLVGNLIGFSAPNLYGAYESNGVRAIQSGTPLLYEVTNNGSTTITENGGTLTVSTTGSYTVVTDQEYALARFEDQNQFNLSFYFDGKIAEVVSYSTTPSAAESDRIESYLAIKYGISRDQSSAQNYVNSSGTTVWDATTNSTHNNDIAGIGRDDDSCLDQRQSTSQGTDDIVTIGLVDIAADNISNTNAFEADNSFLIWGNDDGPMIYGDGLDNGDDVLPSNPTNDITDVTGIGTVTKRMTRIWRVDESGTVGNTEVSFDLTGLGYPSTNASDYQLIIADNASLTGATTFGGGSFNGNVLTFDNIDFTDGDYFTLGIERTTCGPGGISTDLALWLRADDGTNTTTNGGDLTSWNDQSSAARNGTNDDLGGQLPIPPTYLTEDINFNPSIEFKDPGSTNAGFVVTGNGNSVEGNLSMVAVFKTGQFGGSTSDFEDAPVILGAGQNTSTADYGLGISEGRVHFNAASNSALNARSPGGITYNDLEPHILTGTRVQSTASGSIKLYIDSDNVVNDGISTNTTLSDPIAFGIGNLGQGPDAPTGGNDATVNGQFNGEIAEAIVYADELTAQEQQQVESYLAIKYGITRAGESGREDYVASDAGVIWNWAEQSGTYNNDIAGIGRDDGSCFVQFKSKSENSDALVTMESATFGTDDSFLIWGNDNADLYRIRNTERPAGIKSRLNREWYVQETGTVGTITLTYDLTSIEGPQGVGTNDLSQIRLLVDDDALATPDGDFSSGVTLYAPATIDEENNIITFEVDFQDGEFFTLGSFAEDSLPVELIEFEAEAIQGEVLLEWSTASEENNAYFAIEHSANGREFETIGTIAGNGTQIGIQNYSFWDYGPIKGFNFYRLRQVDIGGTFSYSPVRSILIEEGINSKMSVSPNPATDNDIVEISFTDVNLEQAEIQINDLNGHVIKSIPISPEQRSISLNIKNWKKGLYLVRLFNSDQKISTRKLLIR